MCEEVLIHHSYLNVLLKAHIGPAYVGIRNMERKSINISNMGKSPVLPSAFGSMKELTLERSPMKMNHVIKAIHVFSSKS